MYRACNYWQSFCLTWVKIDDYAFRYLLRFFQYFPGMKLNSSSSYLNNASFCSVHWPLSSSPNYAWFPTDLSFMAVWLQCVKQRRPSWIFLLHIRYLQSFSPRGILWFLVRGELRTAGKLGAEFPSAGKLGAGSPLSTWTLLGGVWNLQKQNYLWQSTVSQIRLQWLMGSKMTVSPGENERKQVVLLQAPAAPLCSPLLRHRPEQLSRSLLITAPAILVLKAAQAVSPKTYFLKHGYFGAGCYGAGCLLGFHSNAVFKTWVKRVLMYFEITIDKKEKQRFN